MNKAYDYQGTIVSMSKPVKKLRSVRKTIHLDSGDRDKNIYKDNKYILNDLEKLNPSYNLIKSWFNYYLCINLYIYSILNNQINEINIICPLCRKYI